MQAVVMAGGEGSRLRPLTSNVPKPMLPVANRPLMEHIIQLLKRHGGTDVVVTVQFLASVISNYFGDGSDLDVSLSYSNEDEPLGTAGSVLNARDLLSGPFVVISGDALTDIDLDKVVQWHKDRRAAATIVLKPMNDPLEFGVVMTDDDGRIERFLEKPTWGQVFSDRVNTGIYVIEPEVLDLIPPAQPFDFSSELFPLMVDKGVPLFGYVTDEYWTDVGNNDAYLQAHYDVLDGRVTADMQGFELRPGVWVGEDVEVDPTVDLAAPVVIGDSCRIGAGAQVGPYAVVGDNVTIDAEARISNGVVMDRAHVGSVGRVLGGVLGRGSSLEAGATLEEGAVVGDDVVVGSGALIQPRVRIYPSRSVEAGAIVSESLVRERRASRSLFGSRGVAGAVNVGVTPQMAVRLGMAYGSMLKRSSVVMTGRDASRSARTLKRALIAGLNSTGVTCRDLELMPMPVTRFATRSEQAAGGVSVRTSPANPEIVEIRLFDGEGADIPAETQRKIDRMYFREDFRRPGPHRLGELEFPPHVVEQYATGLLARVDVGAIRRRAPKVVVDYALGASSITGPSILGRLGCDALALNAFIDEHRPVVTAEDLPAMLANLADHVRNSGADLGVILEPGGEVAHLVDDRGRSLESQAALIALLRHQVEVEPGGVAVPVSAPSACERIATGAGVELSWTPTAASSVMAHAGDPGTTFAGSSDGLLIFPRFMPAPDGFMTFAKVLEMISIQERALSDIADDLPRSFVAQQDAQVPADAKGLVMRRLGTDEDDGARILVDGVKVAYEDRWFLVVPSADRPTCRVWAEAPTMEEAEKLAATVADRVEAIAAEEPEETSRLVD